MRRTRNAFLSESAAIAKLEDALEAKNSAYEERNRLVAYVAALFPSALGRHPEDDTEWEDDWRWIIYIHHPQGQLSWHIHDSELVRFAHVPRDPSLRWDGHTTEEKYARIEAEIQELAGQETRRGPIPEVAGQRQQDLMDYVGAPDRTADDRRRR